MWGKSLWGPETEEAGSEVERRDWHGWKDNDSFCLVRAAFFPFVRLNDEIVLNFPQPQLKFTHEIKGSVAELKQCATITKALRKHGVSFMRLNCGLTQSEMHLVNLKWTYHTKSTVLASKCILLCTCSL